MDIKIITIHAMDNPGSVFQAYALQTFLNSYCTVRIIDYRPGYFYSERSKLKQIIKTLLYGKEYRSRRNKFDSFIETYMLLTDKYISFDELCTANLSADVFISGSDQLWNSDYKCGEDPSFYLEFAKEGIRISYSTSVGKRDFTAKDEQLLTHYLPKYSFLSVRESSTATKLELLIKRHVQWVCDPVFLLNSTEYLPFISENKLYKSYVMVYLSEASEALDSIVEYFKSIGKKIVLAGGFTKRCYCDTHLRDIGPCDFLTCLYHADYIISSSFHATAFSLIFHKDFFTILPDKNGERIVSILNLTGLDSRAAKGFTNHEILTEGINWNIVDERLNKHIEESKKYLITSCGLKKGEQL